jgi:hypothetical protein
MDRTLIAWNIPNLITVPLMAFGAFLIVGAVYQLAMMAMGNASTNGVSNNSGGY